MKKRLIALLVPAVTALSISVGAVTAYALSGTGIEVVASEVSVVKTALSGKKITFSDGDFKSAFALADFKSITVTAIPSSTEGTLMLAGRRVYEGQTVKRRNIGAMVFVPASADVEEADFSFTLCYGPSTPEARCIMKFIDRVNYAPTAERGEEITTQAQIPYHGKMNATDPEGDAMTFMVVSYPDNGRITVVDSSTGAYKYTPAYNFTGYDKFVYVARDAYGNYTSTVTVDIKVIDRMSDQVYVDMTDRAEYNAAITMTAMGIMNAGRLGDDLYFDPDTEVSRAEFVAMAMKAAGIKADTSLTKSFFDDNSDIPKSLVSYVATASRLGFIDGEFKDGKLTFSPKQTITAYEAATVMCRIMGIGD